MTASHRYPLQWPIDWPRTAAPERSRFGDWNRKPTIAKAVEKLAYELRLLGSNEWAISSNLKYRLDGLPYSKQPPLTDCGVAVYFDWNGQHKVIACDSFDQPGCNLWAIAKTVEAMRGIDRWGCSAILERAFTGFAALPAQSEAVQSLWWEVLDVARDCSAHQLKAAYHQKALATHPDRPGGSAYSFTKTRTAYEQGCAALGVKP